MKIIKADHHRRIEIPGVPGPVPRPVDIDRSRTGFANLRSLRVYRFAAKSVIEGHAEEDEVFVVVIAGSIELTVSGDNSGEGSRTFKLAAATTSQEEACVAYLPPQAAYRLVSQTDSEVAYARATPADGPVSTVFAPQARKDRSAISALLEETEYARRLQLRLIQIEASQDDVSFSPIEAGAMNEALIHVRTVPGEGAATMTSAGAEQMKLDSWDTACVAPGEHTTLTIAKNSSALVLIVCAS